MKNPFVLSSGKTSRSGVFPIFLFCLMIISSQLISCAAPSRRTVPQPAASSESLAVTKEPTQLEDQLVQIEEKWGIHILGARQSANGYIIDFRYRIIDPEKSSSLLDRKIKPYLVDQATGARLTVPNMPKLGALRAKGKPEANREFFILFGNPGGAVKKGSQVTVVIGDLKVENLVVE
jgi:hypothetical protein